MTAFASTLLTVIAEMQARPGQEDALRAELTALVAPTRLEEGCVQYDLHESESQPGSFVFYENWTSAAALAAHGQSAHISSWRGRRDAILAGPAKITKFHRIA